MLLLGSWHITETTTCFNFLVTTERCHSLYLLLSFLVMMRSAEHQKCCSWRYLGQGGGWSRCCRPPWPSYCCRYRSVFFVVTIILCVRIVRIVRFLIWRARHKGAPGISRFQDFKLGKKQSAEGVWRWVNLNRNSTLGRNFVFPFFTIPKPLRTPPKSVKRHC